MGFMRVVLAIVRLLLAATFGVAGVAKLADPGGSRQSTIDFGVPVFLARVVALLLPLAELGCAAALIPVSSAWWGACGALALLVLFIAGIGVSLARGRRPNCHCFGQLHSSPIGWRTLARNAVLSGMAALVVWQGPENSGGSAVAWVGGLSGHEGLVAAIAVLAVFELWMFAAMLRQNGRLMLRLEAVEAKLGISAEAPAPGLPVNSPAPGFSLVGLDGGTVTLDMLRDGGKPLLLVFTEPGCSACDALLPELAHWQEDHAERLTIVPITRGGAEANRARMAEHEVQNVLLQTGGEPANAYRAASTPSAVLVTEGRVASPLAAGIDGIRALVASAVLPPPVKTGDLAPALRLVDLDGNATDLAPRRGRRMLLLFWNPSCGFCQQMLEDVKKWERNRPEGAPELLVISAGSSEANREQGFRSPVLLDQNFAAGQVFGAGGTPSAVMLDGDGRVASEVGVGAAAVMALAGAAPGKN
ncbi:DoxX family protein [Candidatus Sulfopaludibacter sp. SbA4]|nr:DoxX family protein [Candidatus Sulfopaludibacter sp. SbA4]